MRALMGTYDAKYVPRSKRSILQTFVCNHPLWLSLEMRLTTGPALLHSVLRERRLRGRIRRAHHSILRVVAMRLILRILRSSWLVAGYSGRWVEITSETG